MISFSRFFSVTQNFTTSPEDTKILFGYNATFQCVSVGVPTPLLTWARKINGKYEELTSNEKYVIGPTSLSVIDARYEDELEYACFSKSPRLVRNATAMLDVYGELLDLNYMGQSYSGQL